ncbi:MAG: LamG-like jellyroll fold domain-containing protein, partial [Roseimicrobium sp.]
GGVFTVQEIGGGVFDALVFGEKDPRCWLAGSNNFKRTQSLEGPAELEAANRPVHVALVYDGKGKITGYRDGQPYGQSYQSDGPALFASGESNVQLGCRHGGGGGNKLLKGRILRARLYDRALKPDEIAVSRWAERTLITERDVLEALADAGRARVRDWQSKLEALREKAGQLRSQIERSSGTEQTLQSLALSLINLKEFVYLR